jgi:hypothetical protein
MNHGNPQYDWLRDCVDRYCDGVLAAEDVAALEQRLGDDPEAMDLFLLCTAIHSQIAWNVRACGEGRERTSTTAGAWDNGSGSGPTSVSSSLPLSPSPPLAVPSSLFSLSSPLGSFVFSYAAATLIVGVGILIAWMCHVSEPQGNLPLLVGRRPPAVQKPGVPEHEVVSVARVTDMVEVTWADANFAPSMQRILLGDKFALASGLMEITYDTGAKVVLQGPCTYAVESKTSGFLERGRLTARVARVESAVGSRQSAVSNTTSTSQNTSSNSLPTADCRLPTLFSIRTPNAVVNDLGTEFGVEVDEHKGSRVQVFVGTVDFVPQGRPLGGIRLSAGDARRISAASGAVVEKIAFERDGFAKPRAMLAGKYKRDEVLFHETFESFALGTRWTTSTAGPPDDVLKAVVKDGRTALWMKNKASTKGGYEAGSIETIEPIPLQDMAAIQVDVVFKTIADAPMPFETFVAGMPTGVGASGLSKKCIKMALGKHQEVRCDVCQLTPSYAVLASQVSPPGVCRGGQRYRAIFLLDRQGAQMVLKDDINLAVVYQAKFDKFTLNDIGDGARLDVRLLRPRFVTECWVFEVTVRGRYSAVRYPPAKGASQSQGDNPSSVSGEAGGEHGQRHPTANRT